MEFAEAVDEILGRGPGRMIPDLDRITALAKLMGDPQVTYPTVHVTGTNGKGSTVRMVTALFSAAGLSAGTYTSPHLQTIRERLSIAGRAISDDEFARVYTGIAPLADMVDEELAHSEDHVTFFEILTAMAYWWFADSAVDVGVFEVGMGGQWDATNLVRGEVAVLTDIDLDHPQLGDTAEAIAREKTGIVKDGSHVVSARQSDLVLDVIESAAARHDAPLWVAGRDFAAGDRRVAVGGQQLSLRVGERRVDEVFLPLFGRHQAENAAVALAAFASFLGEETFANVGDDLIREAFAAVEAPGRLEVVAREPVVVLDGAHNPHGAQAAAAALDESFGFRNLVLVIACLDGKNIPGIVEAYRDHANHVVVTQAPSHRAATVETMQKVAADVWAGTGVIIETATTVADALDKAIGVAGEGDGVLVTGSLYTVGAARDQLVQTAEIADDG